jgi:hypothetical protein
MANPSVENNVFVTFYTDAVEFPIESEKAGRPIFKDVPFIRITIPGDTNNIIEHRAKSADFLKYPKAYEMYQRGERGGHTGTPLEQWPQITRAQVKEAKYFECHTVEQMSLLSDAHCQKLGMGFAELRNKAKAYLAAAAGTADSTSQAAENERMRAEIAEMRAQMAQLAELSEKRTPGRPRKEVEVA